MFYALKSGQNDGLILKGIKNCVHAVFCHNEPHGDVYAYVSEWLAEAASQCRYPSVPHIISLPNIEGDLRLELNIPESATVYGRYGGIETFDIPFVKREVYKFASRRPETYFIFMNTENFLKKKKYYKYKTVNKIASKACFPRTELPNIIFIEGTSDIERKVRFINTCDAMLHARTQGESFGIACGEFSVLNKPIITCNANWISERNHIAILEDKGLYYATASELRKKLENFKKNPNKNWDAYTQNFNPTIVMERFKKVFLNSPY